MRRTTSIFVGLAVLAAVFAISLAAERATFARYEIIERKFDIVRMDRITGETVVAHGRSSEQWQRILEPDDTCVELTEAEQAFLDLQRLGMPAERVSQFARYGYSEWVKEHDPADTPLMVSMTAEEYKEAERLAEEFSRRYETKASEDKEAIRRRIAQILNQPGTKANANEAPQSAPAP